MPDNERILRYVVEGVDRTGPAMTGARRNIRETEDAVKSLKDGVEGLGARQTLDQAKAMREQLKGLADERAKLTKGGPGLIRRALGGIVRAPGRAVGAVGRGVVGGVYGAARGIAGGMVPTAGVFGRTVGGRAAQVGQARGGGILGRVAGALTGLTGPVRALLRPLASMFSIWKLFQPVIETLLWALEPLIVPLQRVGLELVRRLVPAFGVLSGILMDLMDTAMPYLIKAFDYLAKVVKVVAFGVQKLANNWRFLVDQAKEGFKIMFEYIADAPRWVVEKIAGAFKWLMDKILSIPILGTALRKMGGAVKTAAEYWGIDRMLKAAGTALKDVAVAVKDTVGGAVKATAGFVADAAKGIKAGMDIAVLNMEAAEINKKLADNKKKKDEGWAGRVLVAPGRAMTPEEAAVQVPLLVGGRGGRPTARPGMVEPSVGVAAAVAEAKAVVAEMIEPTGIEMMAQVAGGEGALAAPITSQDLWQSTSQFKAGVDSFTHEFEMQQSKEGEYQRRRQAFEETLMTKPPLVESETPEVRSKPVVDELTRLRVVMTDLAAELSQRAGRRVTAEDVVNFTDLATGNI